MLVSVPQNTGQWTVEKHRGGDMRQAASPLAQGIPPGDRYPHPHRQQVQQVPTSSSGHRSQDQNQVHRINPSLEEDFRTNSPKTKVIMTGNGFFVNSSGGGLAKTKSGTLPPGNDHYSSPARGFRDTFVSSMNPQSSSSHFTPPQMGNRNELNSSPVKESATNANNNSSKKWTFGGLFKRKVKAPSSSSAAGNINSQTQSPTMSSPMSQRAGSMSHSSPSPGPQMNPGGKANPINAQFQQLGPNGHHSPSMLIRGGSGVANGNKYVSTPTQTRHKSKLSESDITSEDSELEGETAEEHQKSQQQQHPAPFKQNFLTRRLSRRKEKAAAKKKAADGLLKVPKLNNGKRVGSSPESLNNGNVSNIFGLGSNGPWPSWEITKKVPQLQAVNNYSSSGSLSLSQEGSTKGFRAAAKEAVKARAVARRESFIQDSSSEEEVGSRSSIQGSHSSLASRNRRPLNGISNVNNNYAPIPPPPHGTQGQAFRPVIDYVRNSPSSPAKFDRHNNNSASPKTPRKVGGVPPPPGSPRSRWEARVIYTQENHEDEIPFVVKLPSSARLRPSSQHLQSSSPAPAIEEQHVITAGLRVPISSVGSNQVGNGKQITEEVHYANLPNNTNHNVRYQSPTQRLNNYHNAQPSPPPPPPPRREFNRQMANNNQNFYRPVSCSYLDSYQGYYNNQANNVQRNASPNINRMSNVSSFNSPDARGYYESQQQQQQPRHQFQPQNGNYYYDNEQVDNVRHNNNFLLNPTSSPYKHHAALMRSPSEPPEIKVQYARESQQRNALTPSPAPPSYYYNNQEPNESKGVITSKMGFPVRKLQDAGKIPLAQSPVHMRASEFWRKKEAEVTGNPVQPNPNHQRYMTRIRSADSSPLPVHRMRNSPVIQNSNESISSLSSFSTEAASPHSHLFGTPKRGGGQRMGRKIQNSGGDFNNRASSYTNAPPMGKNTDNFGNILRNPQRQESSKSDREKTPNQSSASERLKVRILSAPETKNEDSNKLRSLVDRNNGKTPGRNLEDALNELEVMYKSLRLSDEDLLDRAERKEDLSTVHQELRNAPLTPLPSHHAYRYEPIGSVESLATGSSSTGSGTNYSNNSSRSDRVRAPPLRRSAIPDTVQDDMARRRFEQQQETKPLDPRNVVAQTGSYMVLSPAFSPPVSPCPPENLHFSLLYSNQNEPDLTFDDVSFRTYKQANSIKIIDPQPLFGIPLGPITTAPGTDYLHSKRSDRLRPLFKAVKNPDLVNDDIAFRNLRKDLNCDNNLSKDWTPRLFSPTRENIFNYNSVTPDQQNKKLRAIRSLSANITNYVPFSEFGSGDGEMGKWNSFTDLHQHHHQYNPRQRASSYWRPSWVDQVEKVQSSNNKFPPEPEQHWERKVPLKTVELTPDLYDPTKSRRPWTDIILDSFEKEKQLEIERIAAEAAEANANVNSNRVINDSSKDRLQVTEEDDDVFLDARDKSKSTSPEERLKIFQFQQNQQQLLLLGQNTRRGSWVEPSRTSSTYLSVSDYADDQERRRKSWSDIPNNNDKLFNPLPPPKKIKQIKFNASQENKPEKNEEIPKGEAELNALMDMLIREADTCGVGGGSSSSANSDTKTTHVNVSLSQGKDQCTRTQKDDTFSDGSRMSVPKIPQKESQIDEPTKNKSWREDYLEYIRSSTPDESSLPEIVAYERKLKPSIDNDNRDDCKGDTNLPLNYSTSSSTTSNLTFSNKNPFSSSVPKSQNSCSIEELIDSINESLPELEASGAGSSSSTKSTGGSSLSSVGSGSGSPPSIPSPRPGSPTTIVLTPDQVEDIKEENATTIESVPVMLGSRRSSTNSNSSSGESQKAGPSSQMKKEEPGSKTNERNVFGKGEKMSGLKAHFPFLRNSNSKSRTVESVSSSPTATQAEVGEERKDKSHKRKSHLNQAFSDEPVPNSSSFHPHSTILERKGGESVGKKSSTSICKVPPIPSILTTNNHSNTNSRSKSPDNSISTRHLPPSPSFKHKSYKVSLEAPKSGGPMVKQDSFSDAEGVSFIKKLLQKESMAEKVATQVKHKELTQQQHSFILKKSPSTGSNWSKGENSCSSQPVFFKKFFEKEKQVEEKEKRGCDDDAIRDQVNKHEYVVDADDKGLGGNDVDKDKEPKTSVAQKASFFMKLEHEQRFSKWRKNSLDGSTPSPITFGKANPDPVVQAPLEGRSRSRQLTQPITTTEVQLAALNSSAGAEGDQENILLADNEAENSHEPSQRSLKDRVHMFDKLIRVPLPKAPSASTNPPPPLSSCETTSRTAFPMKHSSSAIMPSSIPISHRVSNKHVTSQGNNVLEQNKHTSAFIRRGSTSDLELSAALLHPKLSPVLAKRNIRTRSMYVNNDESEDGEVSSGGQEVAEIISRSYENSPVARKKSLKNQNHSQATFTKEIWRRCKVNENNFNAKDCPQSYKVTTNVTHKIAKDQLCENSKNFNVNVTQGELNHNASPATSNLLQILTVLTCTTDELDKNKSNSNNSKRSFGSTSDNIGSITLLNKSNLNSSRVAPVSHQVHVFHPDDEAFQCFFGKSVTSPVSILANDSLGNNEGSSGSRINSSSETPLLEMNVIQRESDLLVMKKNVPLVRRKSSGKNSRNPLKTLAARMDFRNQWYTDETQ